MPDDKRARQIIWDKWGKFMQLEEAGKYFMKGNEPVLTMKQSLDSLSLIHI